jgi:hypothetical protein
VAAGIQKGNRQQKRKQKGAAETDPVGEEDEYELPPIWRHKRQTRIKRNFRAYQASQRERKNGLNGPMLINCCLRPFHRTDNVPRSLSFATKYVGSDTDDQRTTRAQQSCFFTIHFARSSAFCLTHLRTVGGIVLNLQRDRELLCYGKTPQKVTNKESALSVRAPVSDWNYLHKSDM